MESVIEQTLGEQRVGIKFNPSGSTKVNRLKILSAELIDLCETLKDGDTRSEKARCLSLAQTQYEQAAMWAVKGNFR